MPSAHLLLLLDTTVSPPRVIDASVYSEASPTTMGGLVYVAVNDPVRGPSYQAAADEQRSYAVAHPWLAAILRPQPKMPRYLTGAS